MSYFDCCNCGSQQQKEDCGDDNQGVLQHPVWLCVCVREQFAIQTCLLNIHMLATLAKTLFVHAVSRLDCAATSTQLAERSIAQREDTLLRVRTSPKHNQTFVDTCSSNSHVRWDTDELTKKTGSRQTRRDGESGDSLYKGSQDA